MSDRRGPIIKVECHGCCFNRSERYQVQGDVGREVFCLEPTVQKPNESTRYIGDTIWTTPTWCPFRAEALNEAAGREVKP